MMQRQNTIAYAAALAAALGLLAGRASAQCNYEFVEIPQLCQGGWAVLDINNSDVAVGFFNGCTSSAYHPFRWTQAGGVQELAVPAGLGLVEASPYRIADDGTITGQAEEGATGLFKLIVWRPDGSVEVHDVGGPGTSVTHGVTRSDGVILGEYQGGPGGRTPFILTHNGPGDLPGGFARANGGLYDVSAGGLVTGHRFEKSSVLDGKPFIWASGSGSRGEASFVVLPMPLGLQYARGMRIDDFGRVAGSGQIVSKDPFQAHWRAFYWENGAYTMLGTLPGDLSSRVRDANGVGQVVGQSGEGPGSNGLPFLWQHGVMVPMSSLVTLPGTSYPHRVSAVNDKGTIAVNSITKMFILRPLGVVPSDIDINCKVNVDDLKLLLSCWGETAASPVKGADINGDGFVNAFDLGELLGAWTPWGGRMK